MIKEHECKDIFQDIREIRKKSFTRREIIEMEALMDDVDKSMRDLNLEIDSKTPFTYLNAVLMILNQLMEK